jgi:hypothetical protein
LLLLAVIVGIVSLAVVALEYLRPPVRIHYLPLFIRSYRDPQLPNLAWRQQDREALAQGEFFRGTTDVPEVLDQARVVRELTRLQHESQDGMVVYLSGYARLDEAGRTHILPADADLFDPSTWLPLQKMLVLFGQARNRSKLLILDLESPPATTRRTVIPEDVWSGVARDLEAVPDAKRFVLCSGAPGQQAWSSEVLGRSVFSHYLEEGLRGRADRNGNGRISVRELADFLRARVDRWARRARGARQTPTLFGKEKGDFTVVDLPNSQPRPARELPEEQAYPTWLAQAWEKSGNVSGRVSRLLAAEHAWRTGTDPDRVQELAQAALRVRPRLSAATPRPRSLAVALAGREPSRDLADALRQVIFQASSRTRGLASAKADEVRGQLIEEFLKTNKDTSAVLLGRASLDVAIADPRKEVIQFVAALVKRLEPDPAYVETLTLTRVATLDLDGVVAQQVLDSVRGSEQAASKPRLFDWLQSDVEAAVQAQHEAMVLLEARGYASAREADRLLTTCINRTTSALALMDVLDEALAVRDGCRAQLPEVLLYLEHAGLAITTWHSAVGEAVRLADRLEEARQTGLANQLDSVRREATLSRNQLDELGEPFTSDGIDRLIRTTRGSSAVGTHYRAADALLATTLVPPGRRPAIWSAVSTLSRRLEEDVLRHDQHEGTKLGDTPVIPAEDSDSILAENTRRAIGLVSLAGLPPAQRRKVEAMAQGRAHLLTLERVLRKEWPTSSTLRDGSFWAWLADRYRYLARDNSALAHDSLASTFYRVAASEYRGWLLASREEYGDIIEAGDPPRLLPSSPITPTFEVRSVTAKPPKLDFRVFIPDRSWLVVTPEQVGLPSSGIRTTPDGSYLVPVRIGLQPTAGTGKTSPPLGVLAQVRLNADRTYHRRIAVPLSPRAPEIVVSASEKTPEAPPESIRLRATPGKQSMYLYLSNPIDKVWNKLQVRLGAGGELHQTTALTLGAREVKRLTFPPQAPTTPTAPTTPATPGSPAALPALTGPLKVEVIDLEGKNEVIASREIAVELADPVEYVSITQVQYDPSGGRNRLSVQLRLRRPMAGAEVSAELGFPPIEEGGATFGTGTLKAKLPAKGDEVTLFADGVTGRNGRALFYVSIDGWARAFVFEATLSDAGAVTPRQRFTPTIRVKVPASALAGPKFSVPIESDNAPPGTKLEVTIGRLVSGTYRVEAEARRDSARETRIGFSASGPGGALVFEASLQDWSVGLDTTRIRGSRQLQARLLDRENREVALTTRTLALGDDPPELVEFVNPPKKAWRQAPLPLQARGSDALVGVKEVNFFVGKEAAGKLPAGATPVPGTPMNEARTLWSVKLPLPADRKGPTDISVQFVNAVGLSTFRSISVELEENDPAKTALGTIKGRVIESDRPQSGLEVILTDDKRAEKGRTKTKDDGTFELSDLPAGKYRLSVSKSSNGRVGTYPRTATEFIDLMPGGTVTAEVPLLLP